jgi:thiamine biosynthesis protein ThiI
MFHAFLIKYSEIGIKGKNRYVFEDALVREMNRVLSDVDGNFEVTKEMGRIYVNMDGEYDYDGAVDALKHVFGIAGICPVRIVEDTDVENLCREVTDYVEEVYGGREISFKVCARRAKKSYPLDSMELNALLGEKILEAYPAMRVDVHDPEVYLTVEVRSRIYIYSETIPGPGGMPTGTAGKAMLLLSGGIDSPAAGYMIAKRGVTIEAVYFHAPPYTSERAKDKVTDLAQKISGYCGEIKLYVVNFTDIQLAIYDHCPHDELTIIMRRYMMQIAQTFAERDGCHGLITGESIGQVASQTMQSLACTNEVCRMPVFRPLIAFDKQDIIDIAQKIDTYETSVLPYEDCCTIFVAKHPVTKPDLTRIKKSEKKLEGIVEELLEKAVDTAQIIRIGAK